MLSDDIVVCETVVSLALICSFSKMRGYLKLGDSKGDEIPEDTIKAVADTLRTSSALKISEDGESYKRMIESNVYWVVYGGIGYN